MGIIKSSKAALRPGIEHRHCSRTYIYDEYNEVIRKVDAATGTINTVAGIHGWSGYSGDNGPATAARLYLWNGGVTLDAAGNLYFADTGNNVIREVSATAGPLDFQVTSAAGLTSSVTAANIGNAQLDFSSITLSGGFPGSVSSCPSLSAGDSCAASVTALPTNTTPFSGNLTFTDNSLNQSGAQQKVLLSGQGMTNLSITGQLSTFLQGQVGSTYTLSVSNTGVGSTTDSVTVAIQLPLPEDGGNYLSYTNLSGPGWSCQAPASSRPTCVRSDILAPGASYPPVTLTMNVAKDAQVGQYGLYLWFWAGVTTTGVSNSTQGSAPLVSVPYLSAATLAFGNEGITLTSLPKSVTLTNQTGASAPLSGINSTTDFIVTTTCTSSLANTKSCTITAKLNPQSVGPFSEQVSIATTGGSIVPLTLTGKVRRRSRRGSIKRSGSLAAT